MRETGVVSLQIIALVLMFVVAFAVSFYLFSKKEQSPPARTIIDPVPALEETTVEESELLPEPQQLVRPAAPVQPQKKLSQAPKTVPNQRRTPVDLVTRAELGNRETEPYNEPLPGHLTISGLVLNEQGEPLAGIGLTAIPKQVVETREGLMISRKTKGTRSDSYGMYVFKQLHPGEYVIRTTATDSYPSVEILVQAGTDYANLVLLQQEILTLNGIIRGGDDMPLADVRVLPQISGGAPAGLSNSSGVFALKLVIKESTQQIPIRFHREGYETRQITLQRDEWVEKSGVKLDIDMTPLDDVVGVAGTVRNQAGEGIGGETVKLLSIGDKRVHRSDTDEEGGFKMEGIVPSDDYQLWIYPKGPYQKYFIDRQTIDDEGSRFDIVLEPLETGRRVYGQMVDSVGRSLPRVSMDVYSSSANSRKFKFSGDSSGYFEVENVPAGSLTFQTYSEPRFNIGGVTLPPDGDVNVTLVLDSGQYNIGGYVTTDFGDPVAVNDIKLSWTHSKDGIRSNSLRKSTADKWGHFNFTGLGPGLHILSIREPGYQPLELRLDPSQEMGDIAVRLEKIE